jgi:hypothetical protein
VAQAESITATATTVTRKWADVFIVSSPYYESRLIKYRMLRDLVVRFYSELPPFQHLPAWTGHTPIALKILWEAPWRASVYLAKVE